jgi:hypothetical protein
MASGHINFLTWVTLLLLLTGCAAQTRQQLSPADEARLQDWLKDFRDGQRMQATDCDAELRYARHFSESRVSGGFETQDMAALARAQGIAQDGTRVTNPQELAAWFEEACAPSTLDDDDRIATRLFTIEQVIGGSRNAPSDENLRRSLDVIQADAVAFQNARRNCSLYEQAKDLQSIEPTRSRLGTLEAPPISSPAAVGTLCSETGSCYGDIGNVPGLPEATFVHGYFRSDGTYSGDN